jgi:spore coat protein CotF
MTVDFTDREMAQDCCETSKYLTGAYNLASNEAWDDELRSSLLNILLEEHQLEAAAKKQMNSKGWIKAKDAISQDISTAKRKFSDLSNQIQNS